MDFYTSMWSITISPKYKAIDPVVLHKNFQYSIRKYLNRFSRTYELYPEFDKNSRLHYHGWFKVHDKIKMHRTKNKIDREIGFTKWDIIRTEKQYEGWIKYCTKEYDDTQKMIKLIDYKSIRQCKLSPTPEPDFDEEKKSKVTEFLNKWMKTPDCDTVDIVYGERRNGRSDED